ncbi:MAG: AAA family ATPase [Opitutaceae bacterium]|jgi:DNA repair protein RecN (Recombination protein N)|nr:AAA family ATPase [Opitutaceae bacterium]
MLQTLHIRNLALLDEVSLEFEPGFTAVTGETGAGKSILLGALALLSGGRADKTAIRQGADAAEVEAALFFKDPAAVDALLARLELPPTEDGVLLLKRVLPRDKPPRITVNGALATLAALREIGGLWVDFHGPGEPQRLLHTAHQTELFDLHAGSAPLLAAYQSAYENWRALLAEREKTAAETRLAPDQLAYLQNQLARIETLTLTDDALAQLERDAARHANAAQLAGLLQNILGQIEADSGVENQLARLVRDARQLAQLDPSAETLARRLESAAIEINDIAAEFNDLARQLDTDPETAAALQDKLNTWLDLKRHYPTPQKLIEARDDIRRRIEISGDIEGALARLDKQAAAAHAAARQAAAALTEHRRKAARVFSKTAAQTIARLGFPKVDFQVRLTPLPQLAPLGDASLEYLFSPNTGEAPLPLNRVASSGELARVMLALKTVLAGLDGIPLLVFDEVDANVGGEIGRIVGAKMAALAAGRQVLCVTHLPQVAAQGHNHYLVEKDQSGARARVSITPIHNDETARVGELARMLGDRSAKSAQAHARELLSTNPSK